MSRAGSGLERKCRRLASTHIAKTDAAEPASLLRREIALTLGQLDDARKHIGGMVRQTEGRMAALDERLLNLDPHEYVVPDRRWERLRRRSEVVRELTRLTGHRHQIVLAYHRHVETLQNRLLGLWQKHQQLSGDDGD